MTTTDLDPAALLEAMHAVLDQAPGDTATRLAVADLLEDAGDPAGARGQRWQAEHGRWPVRGLGPDDWRWWNAAHSTGDDPDDIPDDLFRLLPGRVNEHLACYCPSRRAAEAGLARALEALAVREAVLAGYDGGPCPWCGERRTVSSGGKHACGGCGRGWQA